MTRPSTTRSALTRATGHLVLCSLLYTPVLGGVTGSLAAAQTVQNTTTQFAYDAEGNLKSITQPLDRVITSDYDQHNRVKLQSFPTPVAGQARPQAAYGYDLLDNLLIVDDFRKLRTTYNVDAFGNRLGTSSPDTGSTTNTLNPTQNAISTTRDARSQQATYGYDSIGRVTGITYTSGTPTTFEYDGGAAGPASAKGQLTKMTDESGNTVYTYDGFGALATKTQAVTAGGSAITHTVSYTYGATGSATGHLTTMTYPSGNRVNVAYDAHGRVSGLSLNPVNANGVGTNTTVTVNLLTGIKYAAHGPVLSWNWGNSTTTVPNSYARRYDLDGRVVGYNLGNVKVSGTQRTVTYDAASRITGYKHTAANTVIKPTTLDQTFGYDDLDRLVSFTSATGTQNYSYDLNGNRTALSLGATSYPYSVATNSNRLLSTAGPAPAKTNSYDLAGNLLADGIVTYTYSARGRMSTAKVGTTTTSYHYNGRGERVRQKNSVESSSSAGIYVYDESGHLIGEYDTATGKASREIVYLGDIPVVVLVAAVTGTAPNLAHVTHPRYIYTDHLNTPRVIARATDNKVVWRWDSSDPFGATPPNENPSGVGAVVFNLRMPGQYYDRNTNLFYNYYRDYDPQTGRYVQSDPIGLAGGINTYSYVEGNPTGLTDIYGLAPRRLDPSSQECRDLDAKIKRKSDLIAKLGRELYENKQGLPVNPSVSGLPDRFSRVGHAERLDREIGFRERDIQQYNDKCGPPPPPPPAAPVCGDNCKRVLKQTLDAATGTLLFLFVLVCATS